MWIDVIAFVTTGSLALLGQRWGAMRLLGSVLGLPLTIAFSVAMHGPLAAFIGTFTAWSARTLNMISFGLLMTAGVAGVMAVSSGSRTMPAERSLSKPVRLAGAMVGALSGLCCCLVLTVFVSNLPGGRNATDASLLWRSLHWMEII